MKKTRAFLLLATCLTMFVIACQQKQTEQPSLSDATIAQIMADLHVAEAATTGLGGYEKDSLTHMYFKQVFEIHGVSKDEYERDVRIIARDELRLGEVADSAIALLKAKSEKR